MRQYFLGTFIIEDCSVAPETYLMLIMWQSLKGRPVIAVVVMVAVAHPPVASWRARDFHHARDPIVKLWPHVRVVPPKRNLVCWNAVVDDHPQVRLVPANPVVHWLGPVCPVELCLVCQSASFDAKPRII